MVFIKVHGPPLVDWKYARSWLLKYRAATDTRTRIAAPTQETLMPDPLWSLDSCRQSGLRVPEKHDAVAPVGFRPMVIRDLTLTLYCFVPEMMIRLKL